MKIMKQSFMSWWLDSGANCEFRALLFDIDGTLIAGEKTLPGAPEFIHRLKENKFPFFLLTNDGNHSREEKSAIMRKAGLEISYEDIVSCSMALTPFVDKNLLAGSKFFIMGDLGTPCYAETAGLIVERNTKKINECKGVIVGEGTYDWQRTMYAVMNYFIKNPKGYLLVPNPDSYWPNGPNGEIGIGAGGKTRFLCTILDEYGITLKPVYFGKPYKATFRFTYDLLKKRYNLSSGIPKKRILMLGDSLRSDIRGAKEFGLKTALMLTGISTINHVRKASKELHPDFVFDAIQDLS